MTQYFTVLVLFVSNLCFLRGIEADERVIDKEELYYRQNVEFANALGYEPYSVIESAIGKQRNKKQNIRVIWRKNQMIKHPSPLMYLLTLGNRETNCSSTHFH
ncbi:hypothetical protein DPMN_076612 [Dreissena polymorpha]|uniref:Uncharacterized protein n=1 Tax=Dreissena polymorpha TaxID=45954 RepID=A0A9D3YJC9_DREPO|nr:hypothetical protein DPMN_076612 [Dreissena polymorpha]